MSRPTGIHAAVLTPVDAQGEVDVARLAAHGRRLLAQGCTGLAIFGSTSETASFSVAQRLRALEALLATGLDPALVSLGVGCCARDDTVALTRHGLALGIRRVLMLPPFFYKNNPDEGLYRAFAEAIDGAADPRLEVLLYHFPQQSGVPVTPGVIERLRASHGQTVRGIKDSSGDRDHTLGLVQRFPGFEVYAGADTHLLDLLEAGGSGTISAAANINAAASRAVLDAYRAGDLAAARAGMERVAAVRGLLQKGPLIPTLKAAIAEVTGDPAWRRVRPPLVELELAAAVAAVAALRETGWRWAPGG